MQLGETLAIAPLLAGLSGLSSRLELWSQGFWSSFKHVGSGWHTGSACHSSPFSGLLCPCVLLRQFSSIPSVDGGEVEGQYELKSWEQMPGNPSGRGLCSWHESLCIPYSLFFLSGSGYDWWCSSNCTVSIRQCFHEVVLWGGGVKPNRESCMLTQLCLHQL